jgi:hypothetical protein
MTFPGSFNRIIGFNKQYFPELGIGAGGVKD